MDFPLENWVYNDWDDFDTASANVVGDYTLEIFAHLRNTGRILDNFRCVWAGPDPGTLQGRPRGIKADNGPHDSARVSSSYHFAKSTGSKIRSS
jgi:hypothetical protein